MDYSLREDPEPVLPVQDPRVGPIVHGHERKRRGCAPFFAKHDAMEVGGSRWAPWWFIMAWRKVVGGGGIGFGVAMCVLDWFHHWRYALLIAAYFAVGTTFLLLSLCSLLSAEGKDGGYVRFSTCTIFLHTVSVTYALFLTPLYVIDAISNPQHARTTPTVLDAMLVVLPVAAYTIDVLILQSKIIPRFVYGLPMLLFFAALSLAAVLLTATRGIPPKSLVTEIGIQLAFLATDVVLLLAIIGITRIHLIRTNTSYE